MTVEQKIDLVMHYIVSCGPGDGDDEILEQIRKEVSSKNVCAVKAPAEDTELTYAIEDLLKEIGIPTSLLGFKYLVEAIRLVHEDDEYIHDVTKRLYGDIAKKFKTTWSRVERAIRHAIEVAFDRGSLGTIDRIFGFSISQSRGKATNGEFISAMALELKRHI